jgi:hypothetical protein
MKIVLDTYPDYEIYENGTIMKVRGKYQKQVAVHFNKRNGYIMLTLRDKDEKSNKVYLHRILAEAFIPNPENKPQINHKDGNKLNNSIDNLEWMTSSENIKHAHDFHWNRIINN